MKALILTDAPGTSDFALADLPTPAPRAGEALVRIAASAFNPIDYQMRQGREERALLASPVLGRECAGVVAACGPGVTGLQPGDRVHAYVGSLGSNGTYAEYVALPAALLAPVPAGLDMEQAAALPMGGLTALQCVDRLRAFAPRSVFVSGGAGGVGGLLLQMLASEGIRAVTMAGNAQSRAHLAALGMADADILDYRAPELAARALAANGGRRYDAAIDLVGGAASETCAAVLDTYGVFADIANLATEQARTRLFNIGATVLNIANYARALARDPAQYAAYGTDLARLGRMIDSGMQVPPVEVFDGLLADNVERAHALLEQNRTGGRKLVMRIAAPS